MKDIDSYRHERYRYERYRYERYRYERYRYERYRYNPKQYKYADLKFTVKSVLALDNQYRLKVETDWFILLYRNATCERLVYLKSTCLLT